MTPSEYLELGTTLGAKYRRRPRPRHKPRDPPITTDINNSAPVSTDHVDHVTPDDPDVGVNKTVTSRGRLLSSIVVVFVVLLVAVVVVIIVLG